jgi:toxin ParE1/3/4
MQLGNWKTSLSIIERVASLQVAQGIIQSVIDSTILLETQPKIGQREDLLRNRKNEYRYLVSGNYKVIYWIEEPYVKIATVFECRQNPVKLKKEV